MDASELVEVAKSKGFRPYFDEATEEFAALSAKLGRCYRGTVASTPGNDLYAHAVEIDMRDCVVVIMLRFDLRIYALVAYRKIGRALSAVCVGEPLREKLRQALQILQVSGFQEITQKVGSVCLGREPLERGMMSNTVFAFFFEDG